MTRPASAFPPLILQLLFRQALKNASWLREAVYFFPGIGFGDVPTQGAVIKVAFEGGLDDVKVRRDVEVARRVQAVMTNPIVLFYAVVAVRRWGGAYGDLRKDGVGN